MLDDSSKNNSHFEAAISEYRFAGFFVDVNSRKLFDSTGKAISLSSRAFDTLMVLLENHGETISKSRLLEIVWSTAVVEENNLNQAIFSLRKALGDSTHNSDFILTIPGKGYCFVAPLEDLSSLKNNPAKPPAENTIGSISFKTSRPENLTVQKPVILYASFAALLLVITSGLFLQLNQKNSSVLAAQLTPVLNSQPASSVADVIERNNTIINSVAVLPFTSLDSNKENNLFTMGLHDEVISQLTKVRSLNVIARNSVLSLIDQELPITEIARLLQVESFVSGTILFVGEKARISIQMHNAHTGITLWSSSYVANKQDLAEMISVQGDIAKKVATALEAEIQQSEQENISLIPTESFEAYRLNLAAKAAYYRLDFDKAWSLSKKAMELDPDYIDAIYNFSSVNIVLVATPLNGLNSHQHYELALENAEKLIRLSPYDSNGYILKAVSLSTDKNWAQVAQIMESIDNFNAPNSTLGRLAIVLLSIGDFDRAIDIYQANLITEPLNLYARGFLMVALELAGRREESREEYKIGEEFNPVGWGDNANILLSMGRKEPLKDVDELLRVSDELKYLFSNIDNEEFVKSGLEAFRQTEPRISSQTLYYSALAAYNGDQQLAVEFARDSLHDNWTSLFWFWLPIFDETRKQESFRTLLLDSGIVDYWQQYGWPEFCQPHENSFTCDN